MELKSKKAMEAYVKLIEEAGLIVCGLSMEARMKFRGNSSEYKMAMDTVMGLKSELLWIAQASAVEIDLMVGEAG